MFRIPSLPMLRSLFFAAYALGSIDHVKAQLFQPEITDAFLASRTIDVQLPVGVVAGDPSVSATGGASWSMSFVVPPGTNGVQPSIGVAYNSQGGDGLLGWGWNMTGLSAITRTGTDRYRDVEPFPDPQFNGVVGVTFTSADRFALDGQRMVLLTGSTYGAAGSTYDTEDASFSLCTAVGSGPDYFTVVTKSGTYMEYGATNDSRVIGNNASGVLSWRLNRMRDPNGNYIDYVYDYVDGENRLRRIDYTGNVSAGIVPYNRIQFDYATRSDRNELFIHDLNGPKTSNLLTTVTVSCEGAHMKTYRFNYTERDITKSYLREITEWGVGEVHQLNTTVFKYGNPVTPAFTQESFSAFLGQGHDFYSGDYDGDGDSELLASPYSYTEDGFKYNQALKVYRRDGPNTLTQTWSMALDPNIQVVNGQNTPQTYTANVSNDMNGDGRDDIVLCKVEWDGSYYRFRNLKIFESSTNDATNFVSNPPLGFDPPSGFNIVNAATFNYQVSGDFNGDGLGDIVLFLSNGSGYKAFMYSPSAGIAGWELSFFKTEPPGPANFANTIARNERLIPIDFDGDGQHEIMTVPGPDSYDQVTRIYKFWNNPFYGPNTPYPAFWKVYESSTFPIQSHELLPGDFNGDGKTDLLNRYGQYGEWHVSYSNGKNFDWGPVFNQFNTWVELPEEPGQPQIDILNVADFNGDGRSDICHGHAEDGNTQIDVFYSRGSLVDFEERTYMYGGLFGMAPRMITDMNGDGRSELLNTANIYDPLKLCYFGKNGHERSLNKVANGMNATVEFAYEYATQNGEILNATTFTYPKGTVKLPIEVVHRLYAPDGLGQGGTTFTEYGYSGATVNRTGGGFLGFQRRDVANPYMNVGTVSLSLPHPTYAKLLPWKEEHRELAGQLLVAHTEQTYACTPMAPTNSRRHFTKLLASTTYDDLASTWTAVANSVWDDANGNLKLTTTNTFNIETVETSIPNYLAAGPSAVLAKPENVTVTRTRAGVSSAVKTTKYSYYAATGNVWMTRDFDGLAGYVLTTYDYNPAGTVRTKAVSALSVSTSEWPSEKFRYDPYHRFVTEGTRNWWTGNSYTDVTTVSVTDPKWGKPTSILSPDGLTTLMRYDDFGRLERTDIPHIAGSPRCSQFHHLDWALNGGEYFVSHTEDPGGADTWSYHDLLGRTVRTVSEAFGGALIHASTTFDQRGNVWKELTPHKDGEDFLTIEHTYDELNRPSVDANGGFTDPTTRHYTYANNELTITVEAPTGTTSSTTDATGRAVRGTDQGGDLRYSYDSWGNMLAVRHGSDLVAENTYDEYGRQKTLWAPGAGTTNYTYNAFGKLARQTDANSNQVDLKYDNLGRRTHRTGPEGTTQFAYYNLNGHINDNVMFVTGPGVTRSYTYDQYFRLSTATSIIAGQSYIMQYDYDD
jgi:YD repeat-containing protein